jgi:metallo-beta-lactamase class B
METLRRRPLMVLAFAAAISLAAGAPEPDAAKECGRCEEWNRPQKPFRLHGRSYYVGTQGLGAALVVSEKGLVLLDGGLPQSGPHIAENIRTLGFAPEKIAVILNSHAHFDHAGGIAYLQRLSGARVLASAWGAKAIETGQTPVDDPQFGFGREAREFPSAANVHTVADGEVVRIGEVEITAHLTPGHTPGGTTWSWRSCEDARCVDVVYADSLNAISAPEFRFSGDDTQPDIVESFRASIAKVAALPCDILVTVHPSFSGMDEKLRLRGQKPEKDPFVDPESCRTYAADAARRLDQRVAKESAAPAGKPRPSDAGAQ